MLVTTDVLGLAVGTAGTDSVTDVVETREIKAPPGCKLTGSVFETDTTNAPEDG